MADTLILKDYTASNTYDLLTGAAELYRDGWTIQPAGEGRWTETYSIVAKGTDSQIKTAIDNIDNLIDIADKWHASKSYSESLWLWQHGDGEDAKRALVYNIALRPIPRGIHNPLLGESGAFYLLAITRGRWERTTAASISTESNVSAYAGSFTISAITGSRDARISQLIFEGRSDSGALDRMWIGIRPTRAGIAGFDPRWEAEDAYYTDGSTSTATIAGAYPSGVTNCQVCDFTSEAYANRFMIQLDDVVGANYADMVGKYQALLRYQVTAASTEIYVGLHQGIGQYADTCPIQWLSYTDGFWRYHPMGIVQIPGTSYRGLATGADFVRNFNLVFYAGRDSGSGDLRVDSILLVPREHFFYTEGSALTDTGTPTETILYTHEDEENEALSFDSNGRVDKILLKDPDNWRLPIEGGKVVVVGERTDRSFTSDGVNVDLGYFPRYGTHREA